VHAKIESAQGVGRRLIPIWKHFDRETIVLADRFKPATYAWLRAGLIVSLTLGSALAPTLGRAQDVQTQTNVQSSVTRIKGWFSSDPIKSVRGYWPPIELESAGRWMRGTGTGFYDDFQTGWLAARAAGADAASRLIALGQQAPRLPTFTEWAHGTRAEGVLIDLRDAIAKGWVLVPRESKWWKDFGVAAVGVGTVVGWASFGCAVVATPAGPVWVALASKGCAIVAAKGGPELIRLSYEHLTEQAMEDSALAAGSMVGTLFGSRLADMGTQWWLQHHFAEHAAKAVVAGRIYYASLGQWISRAHTLGQHLYHPDYVSRHSCGWFTKVSGFVSRPTCVSQAETSAN
jgi:hypothetical protein